MFKRIILKHVLLYRSDQTFISKLLTRLTNNIMLSQSVDILLQREISEGIANGPANGKFDWYVIEQYSEETIQPAKICDACKIHGDRRLAVCSKNENYFPITDTIQSPYKYNTLIWVE